VCIAREAVSSVEEQLWSGGDEEETPYFKGSDKLYAPGGRRIPTATSHVALGRSLSLSLSLPCSAKLTTKTAAGCCLAEMRFSWTIHQSSGAEMSLGDEEGEEEVAGDARRDYETLSNACSSCLGLVSLFLAASFRRTER
jgi:hypothetical protein